jgi:hypothetical protein
VSPAVRVDEYMLSVVPGLEPGSHPTRALELESIARGPIIFVEFWPPLMRICGDQMLVAAKLKDEKAIAIEKMMKRTIFLPFVKNKDLDHKNFESKKKNEFTQKFE